MYLFFLNTIYFFIYFSNNYFEFWRCYYNNRQFQLLHTSFTVTTFWQLELSLIFMDRFSEVQKTPKMKIIIPSSSAGNFQSLDNSKPNPVYSYRKSSNDSPFVTQTQKYLLEKDYSQTAKSEQFKAAIEEAHSQSKSSAFTMGKLLQQKASQVRELCQRLEKKESEYVELQKKMLEMMQQNPKIAYINQLYDISKKFEKMPLKQISVNSESSEPSTPQNNTIYNIRAAETPQGSEMPENDFRTTKRLNRQKYLEPMAQTPQLGKLKYGFFQHNEQDLVEIPLDFLPRISSENELYNQNPDSDFECDGSETQSCSLQTPKFTSPQSKSNARAQELTFRENDYRKNGERSLRFANSLLNLRIQNCALSRIQEKLDEHSLEEFKRGFTMFFSPKCSAVNSKQLTPRQRFTLTLSSNVINHKICQNSELSLCKFKKLIKMQTETLNIIWRLGNKLHKNSTNEVTRQILIGLRNDLTGFVEDFNKKYKTLKQTGVGTAIFEQQTIGRVTQIIQLAKSFPE